MRCIFLISVLTVIASGCAEGPTAPSTIGNLTMPSIYLSDAGQAALGAWQYKVTVQLRETGGVDTAVTNIQVQALLASNILATASVTPVLSVSANSSRDAELVFTTGTQVDLSALTVDVTVQFTDAKGNTGSVSNSFSGNWDY